MDKPGGGSIINILSIAGIIGFDKSAAYCVAKGGVKLLTKATPVEFSRMKKRTFVLTRYTPVSYVPQGLMPGFANTVIPKTLKPVLNLIRLWGNWASLTILAMVCFTCHRMSPSI